MLSFFGGGGGAEHDGGQNHKRLRKTKIDRKRKKTEKTNKHLAKQRKSMENRGEAWQIVGKP